MKSFLTALLLLCSVFSYSQNTAVSYSSSAVFSPLPRINVVYPFEGMNLPYVQKTFIFGSVNPSTGVVFLNGVQVKPHKKGGFLAYVPVSTGTFNFELTNFDGYSTHTFVRKVNVSGPKTDSTVKEGDLFINLISPSQNMSLMPGDNFVIQAKATPGQVLKYIVSDFEAIMSEYPQKSGNYYGVYTVSSKDAGKNFPIQLKFKKGIFSHSASLISKSSITVLNNPFTVKTSTDSVILKNYVGGGYVMFLPKDVRLIANGKMGSNYRIIMDNQVLWAEEGKVEFVSEGFLPAPTETGNLVFASSGNIVSARLAIYDRVPYLAYAQGKKFVLDLFNTRLRTNWVVYDSSDTYTRDVFFRTAGEKKCFFEFNFSEDIWGYDVDYSPNSMIINFKFKPEYSQKYPTPLKGIKVILDPGHSPKRTPPFDGTVGATGFFEYEANMGIAKKLYDRLSNLGATVYMTRQADETVSLQDRPLIAKKLSGDIFISLHNNAIPDGEDPFSKPRGFQIYYYHPNSMPLAKAVHRSFVKSISLADEGLRYGDYHVIRQTFMPAILVENAFMMIPEQEDMLKTEADQDKFAKAIEEGILNLFYVEKKTQNTDDKKDKNKEKTGKRKI